MKEILQISKTETIMLISTPNKNIYSPKGKHNEFHKKEFTYKEYRIFLEKYFNEVFILGQRKKEVSNDKERILKISRIIGNIKNMKNSIFKLNNNEFIELTDYEFTNIEIDKCLFFIAICKFPKL